MPSDRQPSDLAKTAEALDYHPTTPSQDAAASRTTARHATDKDDRTQLLAMLALPGTEDDLVAPLPLLPAPAPGAGSPAPDPIGEILMSADAHLAVATSMYRDSYSLHDITEATGVSAAELAAALAPQDHTDQGPVPTAVIDVPVTARPLPRPSTAPTPAPAPVSVTVAGGAFTREQEELLAWGEGHESRMLQALAARTRTGLADLARRRGAEIAADQAAADVEQLKLQLAAAEARLRLARTGRTPVTAPAPAPVPVPADASTPIRRPASAGLPSEQLAEIRAWGRANGHAVAGRGLPSRAVMDAWTHRDQQQLAKVG